MNDEMKEIYVELTADHVRAFFDGEALDDLDTALDEAQGYTKTENKKCRIIIEITP